MRYWRGLFGFVALSLGLAAGPAGAEIALDRVVVELDDEAGGRADIEVRNVGAETEYVVVDAAEMIAPGTADERRSTTSDPEELGLLVTPSRLVLEPGARRIVRLVRLAPAPDRDRIWRLGIRPVVGEMASETTAVKVLIGYGVLAIARPNDARSEIVASRAGRTLELRNAGNTNALLFDGEQCDAAGAGCRELPARRLYPGNSWTVPLPYDTLARWQVLGPRGSAEQSF